MAVNDKKLVNAKALQDVAKGVYNQVQEDIKEAVAEEKPAGEITFDAPMDATINATGGIKAGENLDGLSVQQILSKLLYPHVDHVVGTPSSTPNGGVFEFGNVQTVTQIKGSVTKKSNPISRVEIKDGSTVLATKYAEEVAAGGNITFAGLDIKVSTTGKKFQFVAYAPGENGQEKALSKNTGEFTFVYPYYFGVANVGAEINEALVEGMEKVVQVKGSKSYSYTTNNQHMVIAYPKSYGALTSAKDSNGFENLPSFTRYEVGVVGLDKTEQTYYVYVKEASSVTNFALNFVH